MANLFQMSGRCSRPSYSNVEIVDYHSGDGMARPAIHPGDQLAEELKAFDMSAAELARRLKVPYQPGHSDPEWPARHYRRYRPAPRPLLWHHPRILAESASPLRAAAGRAERGQDHQGVAHAQAPALGGASVQPAHAWRHGLNRPKDLQKTTIKLEHTCPWLTRQSCAQLLRILPRPSVAAVPGVTLNQRVQGSSP
jgi:hypothetical protein